MTYYVSRETWSTCSLTGSDWLWLPLLHLDAFNIVPVLTCHVRGMHSAEFRPVDCSSGHSYLCYLFLQMRFPWCLTAVDECLASGLTCSFRSCWFCRPRFLKVRRLSTVTALRGVCLIRSVHCGSLLWSPYGIGQTIIFSFCVFFLFFPRLISAAARWMSTILRHMVWPSCEFRM